MGIVYGDITLGNARRPDLAPVQERAMADSGAVLLCIPPRVRDRLELDELYQREVTFADGRRGTVPYVGPIHVRFRDRGCMVGALVMGDEVLLGSVPMEDMDLIVRPQTRQLDVHPDHPHLAHNVVKAVPR